MEDNLKEKIIKIVGIAIIIILGLITINSNSKYNTMKDDIDTYKLKISKLEEKKQEYENLIESYKKSQKEDKETIETQETKITELESNVKDYKKEIKTYKSQITKLEEQSNTLSNQITKLNSSVKTLNDHVAELNKTLNEKNNLIVELTTKNTTQETKITELTNKNINNNKTITDLTNKLNTAKEETQTLKSTNATLNTKLAELQEKIDSVVNTSTVNNEIELLRALNLGGNIILNNDIIMSTNATISNKITTIDLNGHNLAITAIDLKKSNVEIKDLSTTPGTISIPTLENDTLVYGIKVNNSSVLKLNGGNYNGVGIVQTKEKGELYITAGNFLQENSVMNEENANSYIYGGTYNNGVKNEGNLVIDGAKFEGTNIVNNISGTLTIKDYEYNGISNEYIIWDGGTLDLTSTNNNNLTPTNPFGIKINKDGLNLADIKLPENYVLYDNTNVEVTTATKDQILYPKEKTQ